MFRDGDRIEVTYKGNPLLGVVKAVKGDRLTMVADGGVGTLTGAVASFRVSQAPYEIPVGRPVAKPDRVEVDVRGGGVLTGVVSKVSAGKVTMLVDGSDDRIVSGPAGIFRFVATPMPVNAARAAVVSLVKGDRVETTHKGKLLLGVVRSVTGTALKMVLDGGKSEIGGPPSLFRKSDAPLPSDGPSPMDRWGMTAYKEYARMSEETTAFSAVITLDGVNVILAGNTGKGGCNDYTPLRGVPHGMVNEFLADAVAWAKVAGAESTSGADESWIHFVVNEKPYGVTAAAKFEEQNRQFAEWGLGAAGDETPAGPKVG